MITPLFHQDCFKVLSVYGLAPGSRFNRTEIKQRTRLHNVPLDKALLLLLNSRILKKEQKYYSLDFENDYTQKIMEINRKQHKELRELPLTIYHLILDIVTALSLFKGVEVFLFGSYAKLIYTEKSDVDIAIVHQKEFGKKDRITKIISKIEKACNTKIEVHYFEKDGFYRNKKDLLVKGILKDGVRLI
ncbi:MAG TPA: nucleotidyltransferase domain-containing protein [Candidatus Nanoarchaeia archaeon]|nr:nucleotidyltransferase domain-containing protein [Candidatus Nanoarchaeia archaeon]